MTGVQTCALPISFCEFLQNNEGVEVYGLDPNRLASQYAASQGVSIIPGSSADLPFKEGSLDAVIVKDLLDPDYFEGLFKDDFGKIHHAAAFVGKTLSEAHRVLKPGGVVISGSFGMGEDKDVR